MQTPPTELDYFEGGNPIEDVSGTVVKDLASAMSFGAAAGFAVATDGFPADFVTILGTAA